MLAVFIFIYLTFLSPQILEQSIASQQDKFKEQGMSSEQIDKANEIGKKYGPIIGAFVAAIGLAIFGAIVALIGAAIFKKEPTIEDIERDSTSHPDPAV
jgi:ABC-type multidrug transport system permease subunit